MMKLCVVILLGACGASPHQGPGPYAPSGSVPGAVGETTPPAGPPRFATRQECDELVDHIDAIRSLSTPGPRSFKAPNQSPDWHRSRVNECTVTVNQLDLACLMRARDIATAARCNSRFFASMMTNYGE
jgi:hypothetical protein